MPCPRAFRAPVTAIFALAVMMAVWLVAPVHAQDSPDPESSLKMEPSEAALPYQGGASPVSVYPSLTAWLHHASLRAGSGQAVLRNRAVLQSQHVPAVKSRVPLTHLPRVTAAARSSAQKTQPLLRPGNASTWRDVLPHLNGMPKRTSGPALQPGRLSIRRDTTGRVRFIGGPIAPHVHVPKAPQRSPAPRARGGEDHVVRKDAAGGTVHAGLRALDAVRDVLGLRTPTAELTPLAAWTDATGTTHVRYRQTHSGLPVWGREVIVHARPNGQAYAVTAGHVPTPLLPDTTPSQTAASARRAAAEHLSKRGVGPVSLDAVTNPLPHELRSKHPQPSVRLVVYAPAPGRARLAYEVRTVTGFLHTHLTLVDAETGAVLESFAEQCTLADALPSPPAALAPPAAPRPASLPAGASHLKAPSSVAVPGVFVDASGTDLTGALASFRAYRGSDGIYRLMSDLDNFDAARSSLPPEGFSPVGGSVTMSLNDRDFGFGASPTHITASTASSWNHPSALSAHANAEVTYAYYKQTHGRRAIDGEDGTLYSLVDVTWNGQPMDNAFFSGQFMAYGEGGYFFDPLAEALDVAAHEMTHGIIRATANLQYRFQSGALNESMADVFAVMVDRDDYRLGETITRTAPAVRDMANPSDPSLLTPQPGHYDDYRDLPLDQDNGGVHVNGGIPSRAAVLIIDALGRSRTEQIYYRALTTYLTPTSDFVDARLALVQSAGDLYGAAEAEAVATAFDAVGVAPGSSSGSNPGDDDVPPIVDGTPTVAFLSPNGTVHTYVLGAQQLTRYSNAVVQQVAGTYSALSVPADGETLWFVDTDGYLAYLDLPSGDVYFFPDLYIQQPGDLRSASISPDGRFVALISAYDRDDRLYVWNGTELGAISIQPPTTQEEVSAQTVRLLDAVDWSPNANQPALVVDAYNELGGADSDASAFSYWNLHEIDAATGTITPLLGTLSGIFSLGNPTYASTDPDVIALNVVERFTGIVDVVVSNPETGAFASLGTANFLYGGLPILDASRPAFAPSDTALVMTSAFNEALLFYDFTDGSLKALALTSPPANPHWFRQGGRPLPVDLVDFDALPAGSGARLVWTTASETNNAGFYVEHRPPDAASWTRRGFVAGRGTTAEPASYTWPAPGLARGTHRFRLRQVDVDGDQTLSDPASVRIVPDEAVEVIVRSSPSAMPRATLIPRDSGPLRVDLFDVLGRRIQTLHDSPAEAGRRVHVSIDAPASGAYFLRATLGGTVVTVPVRVVR